MMYSEECIDIIQCVIFYHLIFILQTLFWSRKSRKLSNDDTYKY